MGASLVKAPPAQPSAAPRLCKGKLQWYLSSRWLRTKATLPERCIALMKRGERPHGGHVPPQPSANKHWEAVADWSSTMKTAVSMSTIPQLLQCIFRKLSCRGSLKFVSDRTNILAKMFARILFV